MCVRTAEGFKIHCFFAASVWHHCELIIEVTLFSDNDNTFSLFADPPEETKLWIMGNSDEMKLDGGHAIWQSPHRHCFTWKADCSFRVLFCVTLLLG